MNITAFFNLLFFLICDHCFIQFLKIIGERVNWWWCCFYTKCVCIVVYSRWFGWMGGKCLLTMLASSPKAASLPAISALPLRDSPGLECRLLREPFGTSGSTPHMPYSCGAQIQAEHADQAWKMHQHHQQYPISNTYNQWVTK